ncbi:hypothetical protein B0A52_09751 [Exophiala mesophila]|uniref:Uncharacterized protein n=1 Tax=Exophiala mesophila TaxID=212818 RepID=A0A438MRT2_EXOME|nr:hypothetical protein B0A52_09751 [Exophiala mesophila]
MLHETTNSVLLHSFVTCSPFSFYISSRLEAYVHIDITCYNLSIRNLSSAYNRKHLICPLDARFLQHLRRQTTRPSTSSRPLVAQKGHFIFNLQPHHNSPRTRQAQLFTISEQKTLEATSTLNSITVTYHYVIRINRGSIPVVMGSLLSGLFKGNGAPITITKSSPHCGKLSVTVNNSCVTSINGYTAKLDLECCSFSRLPVNKIIARSIVDAGWDKEGEIGHAKALFNKSMAREQGLLDDGDLKDWEGRVWHFLDDLVDRMPDN